MRRLLPILCAVLLPADALPAENPLLAMFGENVTLFVPFDDGTVNPSVGELAPQPSKVAPVIASGGMFGRRLVAGSVTFRLNREGQEVLDTSVPGTVLCWVRTEFVPERTKYEPALRFFIAQSKDVKRKLYGMKRGGVLWDDWGPIETFYETFDAQGKRDFCNASYRAPITKWVPGEWRLAAVSWTPEMIGFSLDGRPFVRTTYQTALGALDGSFWWQASDCALPPEKRLYSIDDCAVLDRNLTDDEIRRYYEAATALHAGRQSPHPLVASTDAARRTAGNLVGFRFAYYPSHDKFHVKVTASALQRKTRAAGTFALTIRDAAGVALRSYRLRTDASGTVEEILDAPDLAARTRATGRSEYEAVLTATDVPDCRVSKGFSRGVFQWEGNRLGRSDAIPEPFVPIAVRKLGADLAVGTVCRWHRLDSLGLWKDVRVKMTKSEYGAESAPETPFGVFAGPMRLEAVVGGKVKVLSGRGFRIAEQTPSCLVTTAEIRERVVGRTTSEWDVDGQMRWTLQLEKGAVDALRLVIPLRGDEATLMHACTDGIRFNTAGAVPPGSGRVWSGASARRNRILGSFVPYLWVGGPVAGVAVYGDNDRGWTTDRRTPCQEIVRGEDGTVSIVLNLFAAKTALDGNGPRTIRLGFLATPVKPMEPNWRGQPIGTLLGSCYAWGAHVTALGFETFDPTDAFWRKMSEARRTGSVDERFLAEYLAAAPHPGERGSRQYEEADRRLRREFAFGLRTASHAKDDRLVFYTNGRGIATGVEPGYTFQDEWTLTPFRLRARSQFGGQAYSMDPVPSLLDYEVWCFRRMLDSGACDRIYWDDIYLSPNLSPVGTDAYLTSDGMQPSCGIFRMREQVRRTAVMQKELGYDPRHNWIHMTDTALAPVSAFAGVHYDLEDDSRSGKSMQQRYSRARLLAATAGRQFGVKVATMAYYDKTAARERVAALERSNTGVSLTFELYWRCGPKSYHALLGKIRDWGYGWEDCKVWNWWDGERCPLNVEGCESSSLVLSRGGNALVIVSNWSSEAEVKIGFDPERIGIGRVVSARNFETGDSVPLSGSEVPARIGKGDFVILELMGLDMEQKNMLK